ncbi:MAG TPA: hypothetical protein VEZ40_19720, partial [Pyrinomonadaceae bacterium]|nr:hypothetical protein [Pyrinomonadaceae bacterium]
VEVRLENRDPDKRLAAGITLACLLVAVACSCSPPAGSARDDTNKSQRASSTSSSTTPPAAGDSRIHGAGALDFTLINYTGLSLYAVYVSPHDSAGWEENVLGRDELIDGDFVEIKFAPAESAVRWDLRVEDKQGNNAEWKNLNLREISKITLRRGNEVVLAEAE